MQVSELKPGQQAKVIKLGKADKLYRQKLVSMGIIPGAILTVVRFAPLGDPMEIEVRGTILCLRKAEANMIEIEEV